MKTLTKKLSNGDEISINIFQDGRVFSKLSKKFLSPSDNGRGYKTVLVQSRGVQKRYYVHRLVAEAFLPDFREDLDINHLNMDKSDNRLSNLEVCTRAQNIRHSIGYSKTLTTSYETYLEILRLHHVEKKTSKEIVKILGVTRYTVSNVLKGVGYFHKQRYLEEGNIYNVKSFEIVYRTRKLFERKKSL